MASPPESADGAELKDALQEIYRLQDENAALVHDLEACKDQLLDLMRKEDDITEQSVKEAFMTIFDGIESWIDELSSEENFDAIFKERYQHIMSNSRREHFGMLGLDSRYLEIGWTVKLGKLDTCHFIVISLIIARCITEDIIRLSQMHEFGGPLPFGLPPEAVNYVKRLQDTMSGTLKRDETQISRWRAETVSALVAFEDFSREVDDQSDKLLKDLERRLQVWIGKKLSGQQSVSLRRKVIDRASKALQMISCSKRRYILVTENIRPGPVPGSLLSWNIKDIGSWSRLSAKNAVGVFHCIYPGLTRKGANGQKDLQLVMPTLLGYRDPELQPTVPASRTPSPRKQDQKRVARDEIKSRNARAPRSPSPRSPLRAPEPKLEKKKGSWLSVSLADALRIKPSGTPPPQHRDSREPRDPHRDVRDTRETRDQRDSRDARDARDHRDSREPPRTSGRRGSKPSHTSVSTSTHSEHQSPLDGSSRTSHVSSPLDTIPARHTRNPDELYDNGQGVYNQASNIISSTIYEPQQAYEYENIIDQASAGAEYSQYVPPPRSQTFPRS